MIVAYIILALYLIAMTIIGFIASKRIKTISDFISARGNLGFWVFSLLMVGSLVSGMTALGVAGLGYLTGYSTWWEQIAVPLSLAISVLIFGLKLNKLASEDNILTVQDYLARRFNDSNVLRFASAILSAFVCAVYLVGQYIAIGIIFKITLGLDYRFGIILSLIITLAYVVMGGLLAVSWTSFVQGIIVLIGLAVSTILMVQEIGGLSVVHATLEQIGEGPFTPYLTKPWGPWDTYLISPLFLITLFGLTVPLGLAVAPHIINNVMALKRSRRIYWLPPVLFVLSFILLSSAKIIGITGRAAEYLGLIELPKHPVIPGSKFTDAVFPVLAGNLLPPYISMFLVIIVLAAVMSTTDRLLLTFGVNVSYDILHNVLHVSSERVINIISKISIVSVGLVTAYLAMYPPQLMAWLIWLALGIMFSTWFPALTASLYWSKVSEKAVLSSMLCGFSSTLILGYICGKPPLGLGVTLTLLNAPIYFPVIGFLASTLCLIIVSLFERKGGHEVLV